MNQRNDFSGKPIISQLLQFILRDLVNRTAAIHQTNRYTKTFTTYDHLITLLYAMLSDCRVIYGYACQRGQTQSFGHCLFSEAQYAE